MAMSLITRGSKKKNENAMLVKECNLHELKTGHKSVSNHLKILGKKEKFLPIEVRTGLTR